MVQVGDVVNYASYKWFVIKVGKHNITLLAKDFYFGKHRFDTSCTNYETSEIRAYLNSTILRSIKNAGGDPLPVKLRDVGVTDKVWLLSIKEAKSLHSEMRDIGDWYWLRSPGNYSNCVADVRCDGGVGTNGCFFDNDLGCIRPVIRIKAEELFKEKQNLANCL